VPRPAHTSAATPAARAHALRSEGHLEHFVGIFEEVLELVARSAQHFLCELRRYFNSRHRRIFRDVSNLIDFDRRVAGKCGLQLFGERGRLGVAAWEGAHKARKLRLGEWGSKVNAGNSGSGQQLRKAAFARSGAQRHTVQQNLRSGGSQKHTASAAIIERVAKFSPRGFKLLRRLHVSELVQTRELQQNVQAADKRPRPASLFNHDCERRMLLLRFLVQ
jgi:hypothetical protein